MEPEFAEELRRIEKDQRQTGVRLITPGLKSLQKSKFLHQKEMYTEEVELPESGGKVTIRALTLLELLDIVREVREMKTERNQALEEAIKLLAS